jgi:hypothetical protein
MSLTIALGIAILIVVIWPWLGDWSGSRSRITDDKYWASAGLACPNCEHPYQLADIQSRWTTFSESPEIGVSIHCPECFEIAEFERTEGIPKFIAYARQPRLCGQCAERYNGILESSCPTCGSNESNLTTDANLTATLKESTNNPMNPSGGSVVS